MNDEPIPPDEAVELAVLSILDVMEELVDGLAWGQKPTQPWAEVVKENFERHRRQIKLAAR